MNLAPGTRLGPYEVVALLGRGGMAEIYRARDIRLGREVAVKILPEDVANDVDAMARFEREAKTASSLSHPHLVTIHDIGETVVDGRPVRYIAMELIRGTTLRQRLATDDRDTLLGHLAAVADGLASAHAAGVVHRDLKPENVMVSDDGFAKVVDFGLAKQFAAPAASLTSAGTIVGTIAYMAPEQLRGGEAVDARADVFAFGCMVYEVIARRHPFAERAGVDTIARILHSEPPPLDDPALDPIVRRCLAKRPADRPASLRDVAAAIRTATEATVRRPRPFVQRATRPWLVAVAVVLVVATIAAMVVTRRETAHSIAVLPFRNDVGREADYLSEGIAAEVVRGLSRIEKLRVIASASTSRYRNVSDPREAARELDVDVVLVGTLRTVEKTLLLDAELVDARDGSVTWARQYSRDLANVPALELDLARDVSRELRVELAPQAIRTQNAAAHEAYLRGMQSLRTRTAPAIREAIEHFHRAIELDPRDARVYAALAEAHSRQSIQGLVPTREAMIQQVAEARKALSLDESLPEAHWSLARAAEIAGDAAEAERRERRVLQLDPNFAPAWLAKANRLVFAGRYAEAEEAFRRARSLDPFTPGVMSSYALHLNAMRRHEDALRVHLTQTTQFPDYPNAYAYLAITYSYLGRHDEALATFDRTRAENNPNLEVWKGILLARAGRLDEARAISARVEEAAKTRYLPAYFRAQLRAAIGDRDGALALLEQAKRDGDWQLTLLPRDPLFDGMRSDPRLAAFLQPARRLALQ